MGAEWYYSQAGEKKGPVDSQQLRRLAQSGQLLPDDLLWKEGMTEWKPAREAKKLFEVISPNQPAAASQIAGDATAVGEEAEAGDPAKASTESGLVRTVGASVLIAAVATIALHALQWFLGWGWGSLWAVLSSVVILSCGIVPWMRDHEGHKSPAAALGAVAGAVLGVAYGWFTGGLLSGILFCTSVGTWAAWLGSLKGLTSKVAQAGVILAALTGFHFLGMLGPLSSGGNLAAGSVDEDFDKSVKRASRITLGTEWANVVYLLGNPLTQQAVEEDVFVAKWPANKNADKTFIGIQFRKDKYGRPGLKRVYVEAVSILVNGKEIYSLP